MATQGRCELGKDCRALGPIISYRKAVLRLLAISRMDLDKLASVF